MILCQSQSNFTKNPIPQILTPSTLQLLQTTVIVKLCCQLNEFFFTIFFFQIGLWRNSSALVRHSICTKFAFICCIAIWPPKFFALLLTDNYPKPIPSSECLRWEKSTISKSAPWNRNSNEPTLTTSHPGNSRSQKKSHLLLFLIILNSPSKNIFFPTILFYFLQF